MTRDQAKLLLQSSPAENSAPPDPHLSEALAMLRRDPDLKAWFDAECLVDEAFRRKLSQTPAPAGLAQRIIEDRRARRARRIQWQKRSLALAAAFLLAAVLARVLLPSAPADDFTAFGSDMAVFLKEFPRLDLETEKLTEARAWLRQKPWITSIDLPPGLTRFPTIGCREVQWRGKQTALLCFMVDGEVVHLFLLPESQWPPDAAGETPQFKRIRSFTSAAWSKDGTRYLALTRAPQSSLAKHL